MTTVPTAPILAIRTEPVQTNLQRSWRHWYLLRRKAMRHLKIWTPSQQVTRSQHCKCAWCEYGRDPPHGRICEKCYKSFKLRLSSERWKRCRINFLATQETAFCTYPGCNHSIPTPAEVVDHILPWVFRPSLFWEVTNWQPLCIRGHALKSQTDGTKWHLIICYLVNFYVDHLLLGQFPCRLW